MSDADTATLTTFFDTDTCNILDILAGVMPGARQVWFYPTTRLGGRLAKGLTFEVTMTAGNGDAPNPGAFTLTPSGPVRRCLKVWRWQFAYGKPLTPTEAP